MWKRPLFAQDSLFQRWGLMPAIFFARVSLKVVQQGHLLGCDFRNICGLKTVSPFWGT